MREESSKISLEEIISHMPGNVYWTDNRGFYLGCNKNTLDTLNLSAVTEIIGKKIDELVIDKKIATDVMRIDTEVIKNNKEIVCEQQAFDAEGNWAAYFTRKLPLHDSEGTVIGVLGVSLDITARKLAEQAMLRAKEAAEDASRAKTEFLANMSHDVKTPLSGIIAVAELLAQRFEGEEKKLIDGLKSSGERLLQFFEDCIELSQMETTELRYVEKPFSLTKMIMAIQELFTPSSISKGVQFTIFLDPRLPEVLIGNKTYIYRILLNLVGNALKFTAQGAISLSLNLLHPITDEQVVITMAIQDTGPGIPKHKHNIIFEKMERLTPAYYNAAQGHGIGLYIVDQYVKAMNGKIHLNSEVGQGSTFTITLPLKHNGEYNKMSLTPTKLLQKKRTASPSTLNKNVNILLVEDNLLLQDVTQQLLQSIGAKVDVASGGKEALRFFESKKYALILMDVGLLDMNGYQATQQLREFEKQSGAKSTPIIALTAHATLNIEQFCIKSGMQGALSKPLSLEQAEQIWRHYILHQPVVIDGMTLLTPLPLSSAENDVDAPILPVIDLAASLKIFNNNAEKSKKMFSLVAATLDTIFIPEISDAYQQGSPPAFKKALHKFLGGLCYVSTPALKQAALELQAALQENKWPTHAVFQKFLQQAQQLKAALKDNT